MRRVFLGLLCLLCCFALIMPALAEMTFLPLLSDWDIETMPLELTLSAEITAYAPFGEDRLPQLTSLMQHLSLRITRQPLIGETQSTVSVLVDGEDALSLSLQRFDEGETVQFSALPDASYTGRDTMAKLLGTSSEPPNVFGIDGSELAWLKEGLALLNALESALSPYLSSESTVKTAIKNMGTARLKQDYTVTSEDLPALKQILLDACPPGRLRELISGLCFSGKQTLHVYRDASGAPLRAEWTGNAGVDEDHLRKVSLTWRLRRDDEAYRDEVTLSTPALKGTDNNKLTWVCNLAPNKAGDMVLDGSLDYTVTASKQKTMLTGSYKFTAAAEDAGTRLTGSATLSKQLPGQSKSMGYAVKPDLLITGDVGAPFVEGTVTMSSLAGKNTMSEAILSIALNRTGYTSWQSRQQLIDLSLLDEAGFAAARQQVTSAISSAFIRRLLFLPSEDLDYLFADLPEETVQTILNAAQSH